jgi:long-chain acyl-CoA synthetase
MYPGLMAKTRPDQPAIVMARSGETVTYRQLDERSNRLAHLLRAAGLKRGDHYAVFLENHPRFVECDAAGERAGLYYTNVNSFLTAGEIAYVVNNSLSKVLITSQARRETALAAMAECPHVELCLIVDGPGHGERVKTSTRRRRPIPRRRSLTSRSAPRCSIPPERPAVPRECSARSMTCRRRSRTRCFQAT